MSKLNWPKITKQSVVHRRQLEHEAELARREKSRTEAKGKGKDSSMLKQQQQQQRVAPVHNFGDNPEVRSAALLIDPEQATKWLEGNTHNRPLRQRDVDKWSQVMREGRWMLNGEAIIFDKTGKLLDGQHRLWACVESQTAFTSLVVTGVDPETFYTIDQGRARDMSDHLYIAGALQSVGANKKSTTAALRLLYNYRTDNLFSDQGIPPEKLIALAKAHPGLEQWLARLQRAPKGLRSFGTPLSVVLYMGSHKYPDEAEQFLTRWTTGANLAPGSPVLTLRQRIITRPARMLYWERLYFAVTTWNAFVRGQPMDKLRTLRGDKFPQILGSEDE